MSFQSRRSLTEQNDLISTATPESPASRRFARTLAVWRARMRTRRCLAGLDARKLRELGISPAAAAFESGKPFWRQIGPVR